MSGWVDIMDAALAQTGQAVPPNNAHPVTTVPPVSPQPRIYTGTELMALNLAAPLEAVPDLLYAGANALAGSPKIGKSWLMMHLAVEIALGGTVLGLSGCRRVRSSIWP